jgi:hypothetical protein
MFHQQTAMAIPFPIQYYHPPALHTFQLLHHTTQTDKKSFILIFLTQLDTKLLLMLNLKMHKDHGLPQFLRKPLMEEQLLTLKNHTLKEPQVDLLLPM